MYCQTESDTLLFDDDLLLFARGHIESIKNWTYSQVLLEKKMRI